MRMNRNQVQLVWLLVPQGFSDAADLRLHLICEDLPSLSSGFLWWLSGKERTYQCRRCVPGLVRSLGERNGKALQYCCLGNPMDGGDWQAKVHEVARSLIGRRD